MANSMVYISFLLSSVFLLSSHVLTHEQFKGLILLILIIFVRGRNELMFGLIVFLARQKISTTPPLLHHTLHQLKWITILTHLHSITMAVLYQIGIQVREVRDSKSYGSVSSSSSLGGPFRSLARSYFKKAGSSTATQEE
ncbi:uncharacterized protein LOC110264782 isoform X1 [Arachis ipaensis]|uniref:uncharacterized protein LOC110264782 isoform X1 n=1 Tax=Arachis ipaensis TaxID=130454 RepID=UPI000A2B0F09|nr:uncharacterized protein LOC110264782 isoform X1 [Arachis ipaensis]XP_025667591.1 uncharacterized protein LOC112765936 isoform X1 [Arachis hypogaea]